MENQAKNESDLYASGVLGGSIHNLTTFNVVDARIDARPGDSNLGLPASSFDTSFDNDKPDSSRPVFDRRTIGFKKG